MDCYVQKLYAKQQHDNQSTHSANIMKQEINALKAENEYQRQQLKTVQDELKKHQNQQQLIDLVELVKSYEEQMRELQMQLESQIQNEIRVTQDMQAQIVKERDLRLTVEAKTQQETAVIRNDLSELLLAKENLERLTE